jgi:hypothetical protein
MSVRMPAPTVQPIRLRGRIVAVVADGEALIELTLDQRETTTVKAMCLLALEIQAGEVDGPYTEARALAYAARAAALRGGNRTAPRGRPR